MRKTKISSAILSLCLSIFAIVGVALAQSDPAQPPDQPSDVLIDGLTILSVCGLKGASSELRAGAISERIERVASDSYFNAASITVVESDISSDIVAADQILMSVLDLDAQAEGRARQEIAAGNAQAIRAAIEQYRRDHSYRNLLKGSLFALLSTIGLIIILFAIQKLYRRIQSGLPVWTHTKMVPERVKKYQLIDPDQIGSVILGGVKFIRLVVVLVLLYFYTGLVFSFFPWTHSLAGQFLDYVTGPIKTIWQGISTQVPKLFFILILALITRYVLKLMRAFFRGIERGTFEITGFDRDWATSTYKLLRILAIAFAVTIAYPYIPGSESDAFKGVSIFLGVLVSLGSTSLVSNVVGGLTMTYMRAFKIGDRVKKDDLTGDVIATRLQVTHIKTPKTEIISTPNSTIINSHVINYSALARKQGLILHTTVGIGYDTPWRQVRAMLLIEAEKTSGLLGEPRPFVLQKSLGDFCVTYELNVFTDNPQEMGVIYSKLHENILDVFNEYGVQIMTPNYEGDREVPAIVPKDQWYAAPANHFSDGEEKTEARTAGDGGVLA